MKKVLFVAALFAACIVEYILLINNFVGANIPIFIYHIIFLMSIIYIGAYIKTQYRIISLHIGYAVRYMKGILLQDIKLLINWLTIIYNRMLPHKNTNGFHQKALTPIDNREDIYSGLILDAITNKNIKNIAITGPYGSGKSSIIKAFQRIHPEYKYLNISLASFQEQDSSDDGNQSKWVLSKEAEQLIELSILQQMFYQVKRCTIPDSRFKRINKLSSFQCILYTIFFTLWLISIAIIFRPEFVTKISIWTKWKNQIENSTIYIIALFLFAFGFIFIVKSVIRVISRSHLKAFKVEKCGMEVSGDNDLSILNKHLDEILYYFEVTKFNIVIIEDLDRFENSAIFTKLRELNSLINKSEDIHRHIVFIYAIKDDMFKDKERTKFFDYIVPIIPYINVSNSGGKFIQLFRHANLLDELDKDFVNEISVYIDDMRILNNIFNEYEVYRKKLDSVLDYNKLLAMIVYKNTYPSDFADLHFNKSTINRVFEEKNILVKDRKKAIEGSIDELKQKIECAKNEMLSDTRELRMLVLYALKIMDSSISRLFVDQTHSFAINQLIDNDAFQFLINNEFKCYNNWSTYSYLYSISFSDLEKNVSPTFNYNKRLSNLQNRLIRRSNEIKQEIEAYQNELAVISKYSLAEIAKLFNINSFLNDKIGEKDLAKFLLRNGHIDEDYFYYISFFHEGDITPNDRLFIKSIKTGEAKPYDYPLSEIKSIVNQLRGADFDQPEIINFDILTFLLENEADNRDKLNSFLKQLTNEKYISFIKDFFDKKLHVDRLIIWLCDNWNEFWELMISKGNLVENKEKELLASILKYVDEDSINQQNKCNTLSDYMNGLTDFFDFAVSIDCNDKICRLIKSLNLCIENIDASIDEFFYPVIYNGCHYKINIGNISKVLIIENPGLDKELILKCNYSTILQSNCEQLIKYVNSNINDYVEQVNLVLKENIYESENAMIALLNNENIIQSNKEKLIKRNDFVISNIVNVTDEKLWTLLLQEKKIKQIWNNIVSYWKNFGLDAEFASYLNNVDFAYIQSESECALLSENFILDFVSNSKIDYSAFKLYVDSGCLIYVPSDFSNIDERKILYLIEKGHIGLNEDNYEIMKIKYSDISVELIKKYLTGYIENYQDYKLSNLDVIKVLGLLEINVDEKILVIKSLPIEQIQNDSKLCDAISRVISESGKQGAFDDNFIDIIISGSTFLDYRLRLFFFQMERTDIPFDKIDNYLNIIGSPYSELSIIRKQIKLQHTPLNKMLVEKLQEKQYIRNYKNENNHFVVDTLWNR